MVLNRRHFISAALATGSVGYCGTGAWAQSAAVAKAGTGSRDGIGKASARTVLVVGDSLSAEYGLRRGTGWVALLDRKLQTESVPARVVNASISGDTTSGGRSRLPALLEQHKPSHVIIELGGNDALRGLPLEMTHDNLSHMTRLAQQAGAKVLLVGMQVPPNYGSDYANRFAGLFARTATDHGAALVPFLLKGVADGDDPTRLFQSDRIHPTAQAQPLMLANVWPELRKLLQ
jgi:acyl-CoA thioesterase-1